MPDSNEEGDSSSVDWDPPDPDILNRSFEDYSVESLISQNPTSAVYQGIQSDLERVVAIRILSAAATSNPLLGERFQEEIRMTSALEHPGITTIHDFGSVEIPGSGLCFFVVMEFVEGDNLAELIGSGGLDSKPAVKMVAQICEALEHAHDRGYTHGNIRPENVFVTRAGGVKLGGFVLAGDATNGNGEFHFGTAPEIRQGVEVDHRSDIYSLGAMMFEMLTGTGLGTEDSGSRRSLTARVDSDLDEVIKKATEENSDRRYLHASEIRTEVEAIAGRISRRHRNRKWQAAAAIIMGLVILVGAFAFFRPEPKPWRPAPRPVEADILVTTNEDGESIPGSLREAIAKAKPNDVIGFDPSLAGQSILLTSEEGLLLDKSVSIDAGDLTNLITIDANGAERVFLIKNAATNVRLANLRITGGNSESPGGGIRNKVANLTMENCAIVRNHTKAFYGGGIYNQSGGRIVLENCLLAENTSERAGAAYCNFNREMTIMRNCIVTANDCIERSRHGSAVLNVNYSTMEVIHCTVVGNQVAGLRSHDASNLFLENSIVSNNEGFKGEDIFIYQGGGVETRGSNIVVNLDASVKSGPQPNRRDPLLGQPGDYGGWFPTVRPLPGSPALDAAVESDLNSDIRGLSRLIDGDDDGRKLPDLGAVEFDPEGVDR